MSSVKITLSFAFSFYSNGLVKYQCPSWPELGGITQFDSISYGEDKIKYFLQENIKATLGFTDSPFFLSPETLWRRQMDCTRYDAVKLEVPVKANLLKNFNQDQTPFSITVYYLICSEKDDF